MNKSLTANISHESSHFNPWKLSPLLGHPKITPKTHQSLRQIKTCKISPELNLSY
jgi:hypothetical protein